MACNHITQFQVTFGELILMAIIFTGKSIHIGSHFTLGYDVLNINLTFNMIKLNKLSI